MFFCLNHMVRSCQCHILPSDGVFFLYRRISSRIGHIAGNRSNIRSPASEGIFEFRIYFMSRSCAIIRRGRTIFYIQIRFQFVSIVILPSNGIGILSTCENSLDISHIAGNGLRYIIPMIKSIGIFRCLSSRSSSNGRSVNCNLVAVHRHSRTVWHICYRSGRNSSPLGIVSSNRNGIVINRRCIVCKIGCIFFYNW